MATLNKYALPKYSVTSPTTGGGDGPPPVTDPNIVSYWKFDDGAGATATDVVGSNDGAITSASWITPGAFGYSGDYQIDFGGSGQITFSGNPSFADIVGASSSFTIYAWFNSDTTATRQYLLGDFNSAAVSLGASMELSTSNGFVYDILAANGARIRTTYAMGWVTGTTYFAALSFDASIKKAILYIDGAQASTTTNGAMNALSNVGTQQFRLGAPGAWASARFRGKLDNPIIYNDVRTPAEILSDYNNWQAS